MGGTWSGYRWRKKRTVENCHALDTANLKRLGLLVPGTTDRRGTLRWTHGGKQTSVVSYTITVGQTTGGLGLAYQMKSAEGDVAYAIRLVTTPCHLGGVRWWFVCPLVRSGVACGRRVRKLYLGGRYFGCRHCHGLTYTSTQQSDSRVYAALRGGIDFSQFDDMRTMPVSQLGFALKVLTFQEKRLDRLGRRSTRTGRPTRRSGD